MIWVLPRDIRERIETRLRVTCAGVCHRTWYRGLRYSVWCVENLSSADVFHAKVIKLSYTSFDYAPPITATVVRDGWLHVLEMALESAERRDHARGKSVRSR